MQIAPAVDFPDELAPQQRAAILIYHLCVLGRAYTTEQVAVLLGLSPRGALYLLDSLSSVHGLPLVKVAGRWMSMAIAFKLADAAELPPLRGGET